MELPSVRVAGRGVELAVLHREGVPAILFLHGLAGYGGEWLGVCDHLATSVGLLIPDQRGHGSSGGRSSVGRADLVGDAVAVIEGIGGGGPVVVVGQSMGGIVGTYLASERPDMVAALVLIETGMEALTEIQLDALVVWFESWSSGFDSEAEAVAFFGGSPRSARVWVDGLERRDGRLTGRFDPAQMVEMMRNLASSPRWIEWESIDVDTTLVTASSTALNDTDVSRMLHTSPRTHHVTIGDSGHDVHMDQPASVERVIKEAIRRAGLTRP